MDTIQIAFEDVRTKVKSIMVTVVFNETEYKYNIELTTINEMVFVTFIKPNCRYELTPKIHKKIRKYLLEHYNKR